jgi:hypothetical protein
MTNPTSNFGWQMPTSTDLVTDLPADFETFGQAVDTSLADLKGGTTGQVLAKASNTNMDFTWVAQDDSNAIQNAIVDAKGDLIAASANDTPARLAVGNNGETLVADSSTSTGLRYTAGTVQANPVLNSAFQNWQRGTSISVAASGTPYTADRWQVFTNANQACTVSRQLVGDSTNLPSIQYSARVQRNSGQTGTGGIYFSQNFESINSVPFAGKTVTVSFYARAGANYSAASSVLSATMATGTGTDQNLIASGYTGAAYPVNSNATLTTTWQRFTYTGTVSSTANEICLYFGFIPVGTAGANDYFDVTGVQIDIGSVALPFRTYAATIQGELAACMRYYEKTYNPEVAPATNTGAGLFANYGGSDAFNNAQMTITMQVAKRNASYSVATYTETGTASTWNYARSGASSTFTPTADLKSNRTFRIYGGVGSAYVVVGSSGHWVVDNEL